MAFAIGDRVSGFLTDVVYPTAATATQLALVGGVSGYALGKLQAVDTLTMTGPINQALNGVISGADFSQDSLLGSLVLAPLVASTLIHTGPPLLRFAAAPLVKVASGIASASKKLYNYCKRPEAPLGAPSAPLLGQRLHDSVQWVKEHPVMALGTLAAGSLIGSVALNSTLLLLTSMASVAGAVYQSMNQVDPVEPLVEELRFKEFSDKKHPFSTDVKRLNLEKSPITHFPNDAYGYGDVEREYAHVVTALQPLGKCKAILELIKPAIERYSEQQLFQCGIDVFLRHNRSLMTESGKPKRDALYEIVQILRKREPTTDHDLEQLRINLIALGDGGFPQDGYIKTQAIKELIVLLEMRKAFDVNTAAFSSGSIQGLYTALRNMNPLHPVSPKESQPIIIMKDLTSLLEDSPRDEKTRAIRWLAPTANETSLLVPGKKPVAIFLEKRVNNGLQEPLKPEREVLIKAYESEDAASTKYYLESVVQYGQAGAEDSVAFVKKKVSTHPLWFRGGEWQRCRDQRVEQSDPKEDRRIAIVGLYPKSSS